LWALGVSWMLTGGVMVMLTVHVVPFARDRGIPLDTAALGVTAYGIGAVTGRVVGGVAADRLGTMPIMWTCYAVQAAALVPLVLRPSSTTVILVLAAFGAGFAAADTVFAKVVPEVFGLKAIGAVFGLLTLAWRWGAALGPATAGFFYDLTGSYLVPFAAAPAVIALGFVLFLLVARAPERR
jgi:predicted MFS family arabinose efflux permease